MLKKILSRMRAINPMLFVCMIGLLTLGVAYIYSASSVRDDPELRMLYMRHAEVALLGLPLYLILALCDYRTLVRNWSWLFYAITLAMLILTPFAGESRMGAQRWLFGIQPAEPAKLAIIMLLSWLFVRRNIGRGIVMFFLSIVIVGVPVALILAQPDLGTAMVLLPTLFALLFTARVAPRTLWSCVVAGAVAVGAVLALVAAAENPKIPPEKRERLVAMTHLKPHQIRRLQVFMFPDKDLHGSGYNRRQSEIAVGSGGAWGKGYLKGEQYLLGYLPPSVSSNDFIFAVLAEEAGFAGSLMVLLLFAGLIWSGVWVAFRCKDDTGRLLCVGVITLTFSHMFINIAMTIGIMPITGLPLPFISYGRTFVLTMMAAFGVVQSVSIYGVEKETVFECEDVIDAD